MTVCRMLINAATVEPVGLKANWSLKVRVSGGVMNDGYRNWRTTIFSMTLVRTGVTDIGRKSAWPEGAGTFGIGRI